MRTALHAIVRNFALGQTLSCLHESPSSTRAMRTPSSPYKRPRTPFPTQTLPGNDFGKANDAGAVSGAAASGENAYEMSQNLLALARLSGASKVCVCVCVCARARRERGRDK